MAGKRADLAISAALEKEGIDCSRSRLQKLIEEGLITAGGLPIKSNLKLQAGEQVQVIFPSPKTLDVRAEDRPIDILYQDEHLLVVNKPPSLSVHPSTTQAEGTLVNILLHHVKDLSGIGGTLRPGIVHRIDKNTSGALVITKTDRAHQGLSEVFAKHDIERVYHALCYGLPSPAGAPEKPIRIEGQIGRSPSDRKRMALLKNGGRHSISLFHAKEEYRIKGSTQPPFASFLEIRLETGRTHQIRVHLTSIGHSILGDPVYGHPTSNQSKWRALPNDVQAAVEAMPGQALHAAVLGFDHPITGERLRFEAAPPPAFAELLDVLRRHKRWSPPFG
jgi:23S rRNA pseudouridine1911/1915/1917 synthase